MTDDTKIADRCEPIIPRVVADFGGRRKIFERRLRRTVDNRSDRRSDKDRRSGFDRRSAYHRQRQELPESREKGST